MVYRLYRKRHNQPDSPCIDEETLACFSEGKLSKSETKKIQKHLVSCHRCAEIVSLFCQRLEEEKEVPEFLIEKVKSLVKQSPLPNILEVVLALKEKVLQILDTTGDIILGNEIIPPPVLRSRQKTDFPEEIKLIKEFKDIKITLYIQKRDKDKIRVNLNLIDKITLLPLSELRLALLKDSQELESCEAISGNAVFDRVGLGHYTIQILHKNDKLGAINLEIK